MTSSSRLDQRLRLTHASFGTADLDRAIEFYQDVLGGEVAHEFRNDTGERYGVFLHLGESTFIELFRDVNVATARTCTFRHVCFDVSDIEALADHLRKHGFSPIIRRGRTDGILQLFIEDADGNKIEFQEHDEHSALRRFLVDRQTSAT